MLSHKFEEVMYYLPGVFVPFLGMLHKQILIQADELHVSLRNEKGYIVYDINKVNLQISTSACLPVFLVFYKLQRETDFD